MSEIKIEVVDQEAQLTKESTEISKMVADLSIENTADYDVAGSLGKIIRDLVKNITAYFKPIKDSTNKAHKDAVAMEKDALKEPKEAEKKLKTLMIAFEEAQEKIRLEKERELQKELEKKQARLKALAEAELEKNLELGIEMADSIVEMLEPEILPEDIHVASTFQKTGHTRDNWKGEITDFHKFLMFIVEKGRIELIMVNESALNALAKQTEGKQEIPGVVFINHKIKIC